MIVAAESLVELSGRLREDTSAVEAHLGRLEARFAQIEPQVEAFLPEQGRFERLRREARALAQRYPEPSSRPLLFGVPVGVKDIYHVDGFTTRAGCRLPAEEIQGTESTVVTTLRRAGALVLGKTVTTEFAWFAPGPTHNPHDLERTPGGSSSGSAAAVAAGLSALTLGTQTIGSVGRPASYCGVVGFKPSYGRVSTEGVIALAPSVDHVGWFTSGAEDCALAAGVLCEGWRDIDLDRPPVLGVPRGSYLDRTSAEGMDGFEATLDRLEAAGVGIRRVPAMTDFQTIADRHRALVAAEAATVHASWYAKYPDLYRRKTIDLIELGALVAESELERARIGRLELRSHLDELAAVHGIDIWASPSALGPPPLGRCSTGDPIMNLPWTYAGMPTISLPALPADDLPMGLQLAGRWNDDEALLGWALRLERTLAS